MVCERGALAAFRRPQALTAPVGCDRSSVEQRVRQTDATLVPIRVEQISVSQASRSRQAWRQRLVVCSLILSDLLIAFLIWVSAYGLQGIFGQWQPSFVSVVAIAPIIAIWVGLRALMGLYPGYGLDPVHQLRRHTNAVLATGGTMAVFATVFQFGETLSRLLLALGLFGLLLVTPVTRHVTRFGLNKLGLWGKPVVIMGSGESGESTNILLQDEWEFGYNPAALLDFRLQEGGGLHLAQPTSDGDRQVEDALLQALELDRRRGVDTVLFAMPHVRREQLSRLVGWASVNFRHVLIMPNLVGMTNSAVIARDLAGNFALEVRYNLLDPWALRLKRALDLSLTVLGGVVLLPVLVILSLLVYLDSRGGKVLYQDMRMGRDNRLFSCVKFRTMVPDAEDRLQQLLEEDPGARQEYELYHKLREDPRVTRVGGFLRKTSLDELPQLWNVLRGEMSLVGPRPYLPRESEDIGGTQNEILRVPPGITGPWQVSGRASTSFDDRVHMDAYYVRDWSVWLDVLLLARTVRSVLLSKGAY